MKGLDLAVSSLTNVKAHSYKMAILPWGATEPHNMHLPYLTDSILSHRAAVDAAGAGAATGFAIESLKRGKVWTPRNWKQVSTDTGIGDPRAASAEKGRRYVQDVVVAMSEIFVDLSTKELY